MADHIISHNVGNATIESPAKAENLEDAPPVPLNAPAPDPEKAGADSNQDMKAEPGAKWKNKEVQEIPKKFVPFKITHFYD